MFIESVCPSCNKKIVWTQNYTCPECGFEFASSQRNIQQLYLGEKKAETEENSKIPSALAASLPTEIEQKQKEETPSHLLATDQFSGNVHQPLHQIENTGKNTVEENLLRESQQATANDSPVVSKDDLDRYQKLSSSERERLIDQYEDVIEQSERSRDYTQPSHAYYREINRQKAHLRSLEKLEIEEKKPELLDLHETENPAEHLQGLKEEQYQVLASHYGNFADGGIINKVKTAKEAVVGAVDKVTDAVPGMKAVKALGKKGMGKFWDTIKSKYSKPQLAAMTMAAQGLGWGLFALPALPPWSTIGSPVNWSPWPLSMAAVVASVELGKFIKGIGHSLLFPDQKEEEQPTAVFPTGLPAPMEKGGRIWKLAKGSTKPLTAEEHQEKFYLDLHDAWNKAHDEENTDAAEMLSRIMINSGMDVDEVRFPPSKNAEWSIDVPDNKSVGIDEEFQCDSARLLSINYENASDEEAKYLTPVMKKFGMTETNKVGEEIPFDGRFHSTDDEVRPGDPVIVTRPGWRIKTSGGELAVGKSSVASKNPRPGKFSASDYGMLNEAEMTDLIDSQNKNQNQSETDNSSREIFKVTSAENFLKPESPKEKNEETEPTKMAQGGTVSGVPILAQKGEVYFDKATPELERLNQGDMDAAGPNPLVGGQLITSGSGYKDDVPLLAKEGGFVLKKDRVDDLLSPKSNLTKLSGLYGNVDWQYIPGFVKGGEVEKFSSGSEQPVGESEYPQLRLSYRHSDISSKKRLIKQDPSAEILAATAEAMMATTPEDAPMVVLGRDLWPVVPLLRARGRNAQYFLMSRLQGSASQQEKETYELREINNRIKLLHKEESSKYRIVSGPDPDNPNELNYVVQKQNKVSENRLKEIKKKVELGSGIFFDFITKESQENLIKRETGKSISPYEARTLLHPVDWIHAEGPFIDEKHAKNELKKLQQRDKKAEDRRMIELFQERNEIIKSIPRKGLKPFNSIDESTVKQWKKEVPPNAHVFDTGYAGSIFNAIRTFDPTVKPQNMKLITSQGSYPEIEGISSTKKEHYDVVGLIERLPKLVNRGTGYDPEGNIITASGIPSGDDDVTPMKEEIEFLQPRDVIIEDLREKLAEQYRNSWAITHEMEKEAQLAGTELTWVEDEGELIGTSVLRSKGFSNYGPIDYSIYENPEPGSDGSDKVILNKFDSTWFMSSFEKAKRLAQIMQIEESDRITDNLRHENLARESLSQYLEMSDDDLLKEVKSSAKGHSNPFFGFSDYVRVHEVPDYNKIIRDNYKLLRQMGLTKSQARKYATFTGETPAERVGIPQRELREHYQQVKGLRGPTGHQSYEEIEESLTKLKDGGKIHHLDEGGQATPDDGTTLKTPDHKQDFFDHLADYRALPELPPTQGYAFQPPPPAKRNKSWGDLAHDVAWETLSFPFVRGPDMAIAGLRKLTGWEEGGQIGMGCSGHIQHFDEGTRERARAGHGAISAKIADQPDVHSDMLDMIQSGRTPGEVLHFLGKKGFKSKGLPDWVRYMYRIQNAQLQPITYSSSDETEIDLSKPESQYAGLWNGGQVNHLCGGGLTNLKEGGIPEKLAGGTNRLSNTPDPDLNNPAVLSRFLAKPHDVISQRLKKEDLSEEDREKTIKSLRAINIARAILDGEDIEVSEKDLKILHLLADQQRILPYRRAFQTAAAMQKTGKVPTFSEEPEEFAEGGAIRLTEGSEQPLTESFQISATPVDPVNSVFQEMQNLHALAADVNTTLTHGDIAEHVTRWSRSLSKEQGIEAAQKFLPYSVGKVSKLEALKKAARIIEMTLSAVQRNRSLDRDKSQELFIKSSAETPAEIPTVSLPTQSSIETVSETASSIPSVTQSAAQFSPKENENINPVTSTIQEMNQLFELAASPNSLSHEDVTEAVNRWNKSLTKEQGLEAAQQFLPHPLSSGISKIEALKQAARIIGNRLSATKRIQSLDRDKPAQFAEGGYADPDQMFHFFVSDIPTKEDGPLEMEDIRKPDLTNLIPPLSIPKALGWSLQHGGRVVPTHGGLVDGGGNTDQEQHIALPAGAIVLNRNATQLLSQENASAMKFREGGNVRNSPIYHTPITELADGGPVPVNLMPGERVFLPHEVEAAGGADYLLDLNEQGRRMEEGGEIVKLADGTESLEDFEKRKNTYVDKRMKDKGISEKKALEDFERTEKELARFLSKKGKRETQERVNRVISSRTSPYLPSFTSAEKEYKPPYVPLTDEEEAKREKEKQEFFEKRKQEETGWFSKNQTEKEWQALQEEKELVKNFPEFSKIWKKHYVAGAKTKETEEERKLWEPDLETYRKMQILSAESGEYGSNVGSTEVSGTTKKGSDYSFEVGRGENRRSEERGERKVTKDEMSQEIKNFLHPHLMREVRKLPKIDKMIMESVYGLEGTEPQDLSQLQTSLAKKNEKFTIPQLTARRADIHQRLAASLQQIPGIQQNPELQDLMKLKGEFTTHIPSLLRHIPPKKEENEFTKKIKEEQAPEVAYEPGLKRYAEVSGKSYKEAAAEWEGLKPEEQQVWVNEEKEAEITAPADVVAKAEIGRKLAVGVPKTPERSEKVTKDLTAKRLEKMRAKAQKEKQEAVIPAAPQAASSVAEPAAPKPPVAGGAGKEPPKTPPGKAVAGGAEEPEGEDEKAKAAFIETVQQKKGISKEEAAAEWEGKTPEQKQTYASKAKVIEEETQEEQQKVAEQNSPEAIAAYEQKLQGMGMTLKKPTIEFKREQLRKKKDPMKAWGELSDAERMQKHKIQEEDFQENLRLREEASRVRKAYQQQMGEKTPEGVTLPKIASWEEIQREARGIKEEPGIYDKWLKKFPKISSKKALEARTPAPEPMGIPIDFGEEIQGQYEQEEALDRKRRESRLKRFRSRLNRQSLTFEERELREKQFLNEEELRRTSIDDEEKFNKLLKERLSLMRQIQILGQQRQATAATREAEFYSTDEAKTQEKKITEHEQTQRLEDIKKQSSLAKAREEYYSTDKSKEKEQEITKYRYFTETSQYRGATYQQAAANQFLTSPEGLRVGMERSASYLGSEMQKARKEAIDFNSNRRYWATSEGAQTQRNTWRYEGMNQLNEFEQRKRHREQTIGASIGEFGPGLGTFIGHLKTVGIGLQEFGEKAQRIFGYGTAALTGMIASASPDAFSTLTGSFKLLSATIGYEFIPLALKVSFFIQDLAIRWMNLDKPIKDSIVSTVKWGLGLAGAGVAAGKLIGVLHSTGRAFEFAFRHPLIAAGAGIVLLLERMGLLPNVLKSLSSLLESLAGAFSKLDSGTLKWIATLGLLYPAIRAIGVGGIGSLLPSFLGAATALPAAGAAGAGIIPAAAAGFVPGLGQVGPAQANQGRSNYVQRMSTWQRTQIGALGLGIATYSGYHGLRDQEGFNPTTGTGLANTLGTVGGLGMTYGAFGGPAAPWIMALGAAASGASVLIRMFGESAKDAADTMRMSTGRLAAIRTGQALPTQTELSNLPAEVKAKSPTIMKVLERWEAHPEEERVLTAGERENIIRELEDIKKELEIRTRQAQQGSATPPATLETTLTNALANLREPTDHVLGTNLEVINAERYGVALRQAAINALINSGNFGAPETVRPQLNTLASAELLGSEGFARGGAGNRAIADSLRTPGLSDEMKRLLAAIQAIHDNNQIGGILGLRVTSITRDQAREAARSIVANLTGTGQTVAPHSLRRIVEQQGTLQGILTTFQPAVNRPAGTPLAVPGQPGQPAETSADILARTFLPGAEEPLLQQFRATPTSQARQELAGSLASNLTENIRRFEINPVRSTQENQMIDLMRQQLAILQEIARTGNIPQGAAPAPVRELPARPITPEQRLFGQLGERIAPIFEGPRLGRFVPTRTNLDLFREAERVLRGPNGQQIGGLEYGPQVGSPSWGAAPNDASLRQNILRAIGRARDYWHGETGGYGSDYQNRMGDLAQLERHVLSASTANIHNEITRSGRIPELMTFAGTAGSQLSGAVTDIVRFIREMNPVNQRAATAANIASQVGMFAAGGGVVPVPVGFNQPAANFAGGEPAVAAARRAGTPERMTEIERMTSPAARNAALQSDLSSLSGVINLNFRPQQIAAESLHDIIQNEAVRAPLDEAIFLKQAASLERLVSEAGGQARIMESVTRLLEAISRNTERFSPIR